MIMRMNNMILHNKIEIESILREWVSSYTLSDDGIFIKKIEGEKGRTTIFIFEEYYLRINSNLTLTVIAEETIDKTTVEIISSGGKLGMDGVSYGAEKSAIKRIVKLLKENGFEEQ